MAMLVLAAVVAVLTYFILPHVSRDTGGVPLRVSAVSG
jgi:hypothetical protein